MNNNNISEHSHFEELCSLSVIGQVTPAEYEELATHIHGCARCRDAYAEFSYLTHAQLPQLTAQDAQVPKPTGLLAGIAEKGYKARFIAHGEEHGIKFSQTASPSSNVWLLPSLARLQPSYRLVSVMAVSALLVSAGFLLHRLGQARQRENALAAQIADLSRRNEGLQVQTVQLLHGKRDVEGDLMQTGVDNKDLKARLVDLERQLTTANLSTGKLEALAKDSESRVLQTQQELTSAKQSLVSVNQQFADFRSSHSSEESATIAQQVQIADLSRRVKEEEEVIDKQQKLLSVDSDVRNLMAARSLHITDVFDIDGRGKKKSAFGRVFYTEGKSLVFYAFDLDGPKLPNGKNSFQAWAQLASSTNSAVSLGIFYVDDPTQKRWMLKFDNPDVLEQISAVFVTAERHGGADRPTGQKLMYAYLGHDPNHP
jgi:hypothetical protein